MNYSDTAHRASRISNRIAIAILAAMFVVVVSSFVVTVTRAASGDNLDGRIITAANLKNKISLTANFKHRDGDAQPSQIGDVHTFISTQGTLDASGQYQQITGTYTIVKEVAPTPTPTPTPTPIPTPTPCAAYPGGSIFSGEYQLSNEEAGVFGLVVENGSNTSFGSGAPDIEGDPSFEIIEQGTALITLQVNRALGTGSGTIQFTTDGGNTVTGTITIDNKFDIPPFVCNTLPGSSQDDPVLPTSSGPEGFEFTNVPTGMWVDPPLAAGYTYTIKPDPGTTTSNSLFTEVLDFPVGIDNDNLFSVSVEGVALGEYAPGQLINFADFADRLGNLLINGQGVRSFTISGIAPLLDQDDPTAFPVKLAFSTAQASFNMKAVTVPTLAISDSSITEPRSGTRNLTFQLALSRASAEPVTVEYFTSDNIAVAGADYQTASGTLTFAPGVTSASINVTVNADRMSETNETFIIKLQAATNALLVDSQGRGTILDATIKGRRFARGSR